jgi:dTDP-4-dehydrorhamnose 3,5-epimerase-like enzyme
MGEKWEAAGNCGRRGAHMAITSSLNGKEVLAVHGRILDVARDAAQGGAR